MLISLTKLLQQRYFLGNMVAVYDSKKPFIICVECEFRMMCRIDISKKPQV